MRLLTRGAAWLALTATLVAAGGCAKQPQDPVSRGRQVYMMNCITCHNPDPRLAGSQGPAIAGSPRDLIEARVLHAAYPPGYKPKRSTHAMQPLPQLAPRIGDLAAYLAAAAKDSGK